jgi:ubiquinone/menaquinone biosynthesis C-methylase UbiE
MERVLEPELMDNEQQSIAYARADFSTSNQFFVDGVIRDFPAHVRQVVDIGCGPGDIPIRLARTARQAMITAIDGSGPMIVLARKAVRAAGIEDRIRLMQTTIPGPPPREHAFDAVLSKDLLHHLPDPSILWREVVRLGRTGAAVYVMDLMRPATPDAARAIVEAVAGSEHPILREDFYHSLRAAFTLSEVQDQLAAAGLNLHVAPVSDRHMLVKGTLT